jgi:predicted nucleic acid-binding Zn ribbon protein
MAKNRQYLSIGDAIRLFLEKQGLSDDVMIQQVLMRWEELMGKPIATNTERLWFENGILFVKVSSPAWKHELGLARNRIRATVNRHMKKPLVHEVKIL